MLFFLLGFYLGGVIAVMGLTFGTVAFGRRFGITRKQGFRNAIRAGCFWPRTVWNAQRNVAIALRMVAATARRDMAREVLGLDKDDAPPPPP